MLNHVDLPRIFGTFTIPFNADPPVHGPPMITRISHREASARGMMDIIVLGSNFSSSCRVLFRQVIMSTDTSGGVYGSGGFEKMKVVWQREAQVDTELLTKVSTLISFQL